MARVSSVRVALLVAAVLAMVCVRSVCVTGAEPTEESNAASYPPSADPTNNGDPNEDMLSDNPELSSRHIFPFQEVMGDSITAFWGTIVMQTASRAAYGVRIGMETDKKADSKGAVHLDKTPKAIEFHFEVENGRWMVKPQVSHLPDLKTMVSPAAIKPPRAEPHHRSETLYFSASLSQSKTKKTGQTMFRMRIKSKQWVKSSERQLMASPQSLQPHLFRIVVETDSRWDTQEGAVYFSELYVGSTANTFGWCPTNLVEQAKKTNIAASVAGVRGSRVSKGFFRKKQVYSTKCSLKKLLLYNAQFPAMKKLMRSSANGTDEEDDGAEADAFAEEMSADPSMDPNNMEEEEEEAPLSGRSSSASAAAVVVVVPVLAGAAYLYYRRRRKAAAETGAKEQGQPVVKGRVPHKQLAELNVPPAHVAVPMGGSPHAKSPAALRPKSPAVSPASTASARRPLSPSVGPRPKSPAVPRM